MVKSLKITLPILSLAILSSAPAAAASPGSSNIDSGANQIARELNIQSCTRTLTNPINPTPNTPTLTYEAAREYCEQKF